MAHTWITGKTGTGKSTQLKTRILDSIEDGVIFIEPHGDDIDDLMQHIPKHRRNDVILFDPSDYPIGLNILENIPEENRPFVATSIVDGFKSAWGYSNSSTPVLDQYLYNGTAALLDVPDGTLMGMLFMLTSKEYREHVIKFITDPIVKRFWKREFEPMTKKEKRETVQSTTNKIGMLLSDPRIRNVIGQVQSGFRVKDVLEKGQILLIKLPQGKLGLGKTKTLGALMLAHIHSEMLSRTTRNPIHLFIDECHHFQTSAVQEMLSGIRKFGVDLTLSNQYVTQLETDFRDAVIGNVDTKIAFASGIQDASLLKDVFPANATYNSITELPFGRARIVSSALNDEIEMPPLPKAPYPSAGKKIRSRCYNQYFDKKAEGRIKRFMEGK